MGEGIIFLPVNGSEKAEQAIMIYEILHGEKLVASITLQGACEIYEARFMPCNLYLEKTEELDGRVDNVTNFYYWCATRVLTLDRKYAKEILNSLGMGQAVTDRERARVALSYHCLSLTDIYWVREADGFYLLKDGDQKAVERELLASRICRCFRCNQVKYEPFVYEGQTVSRSRLMTSLRYGIISREAFEIYAANQEIDVMSYVLALDADSFYMMNILDYLVGNTDRHWGNWGFLFDNETGEILRLHDLMDFNQAFSAYDSVDGAGCQTILGKKLTQREAALEAVRQIGLNQEKELESDLFTKEPELGNMFRCRLELLRQESAKGSVC